MTVTQVLNEANKKLGGCSSPYLTSACSTAVWNILRAWAGGAQGSTAGMLTCPAPPKMASGTFVNENLATVYPNPGDGILNISWNASQSGKIRMAIYDYVGSIVFLIEEPVFEGRNNRQYNLTQLANGVYLIDLQIDGMRQSVKFIKDK
ncbi:MAG: T9SS type A sorting domain-containing protein [Bacteroidetes bacterium]|nr:T9SS type A sorting domain-containing protein [Bacteroidota bacterium]